MTIQRCALIAATVALTGALSAGPALAKAGKCDPYTDGAKAGRYVSSSDGAPL